MIHSSKYKLPITFPLLPQELAEFTPQYIDSKSFNPTSLEKLLTFVLNPMNEFAKQTSFCKLLKFQFYTTPLTTFYIHGSSEFKTDNFFEVLRKHNLTTITKSDFKNVSKYHKLLLKCLILQFASTNFNLTSLIVNILQSNMCISTECTLGTRNLLMLSSISNILGAFSYVFCHNPLFVCGTEFFPLYAIKGSYLTLLAKNNYQTTALVTLGVYLADECLLLLNKHDNTRKYLPSPLQINGTTHGFISNIGRLTAFITGIIAGLYYSSENSFTHAS